ncbi:hypothetical protein OSTOST_10151 [Ostertagia ostertagi]
MSEDQQSHDIADGEDAEDVERSWIHQVEHEETIAPEAVHEEEIEEFIEVDGVVDDHDIGQNVLLHPNKVGSHGIHIPGRQIYYADSSASTGEELCMNLPDLLSRTIVFTNGSKMFLCFSKRCRKQLAFEGHLYNINGFVKPANWNLWRCANPSCRGAIRTSPNITELRVREPHCSSCRPDDIQIRLRITVYDLRLMAEFTDLPLDALYHAYLDKVMNEHTDIVHLFPSFETLRCNLEDHRANLCFYIRFIVILILKMNYALQIYRKRFAGEARETDSQAMYYDSYGVGAGNGTAKFRRTKPFPPAWVLGLQLSPSKYRMKKLCLHDEHMYYLCQNDVRHFKNNRAGVPEMHCTAFIRVLDWRLIIQGELNEVVVDYCLDHFYHGGMLLVHSFPCYYSFFPFLIWYSMTPIEHLPTSKPVDYFTPEVFMRDLAIRRERTQQLIQDKGLQRIKRRNQPPSISINPSLKMRKIDNTPRGRSPQENYYDSRNECDPGDSDEWVGNPESVFGSSRAQQRQKVVQQLTHEEPTGKFHSRDKESYVPSYITRRENFFDAETYNTVLQFEMTCDMLKERMQYVRAIQAANHYLGRLTHILDDVMADPECAPSSSTADGVSVSNPAALHDGPPIGDILRDALYKSKVPRYDQNLLRGVRRRSESLYFHSKKDGQMNLMLLSFSHFQAAVPNEKTFSLARETKNELEESLPLRQKVLVRRGDNGQIVVVRRTILGKVRKVVPSDEVTTREVDEHLHPLQQRQEPDSRQREEDRGCTSSEGTSRVVQSNRKQEDGPPIGDILRDALYKSKVPRYDQNLLRGVRRMAYQTLSVQSNPSAEEEARRFVQKYSSKGEESNVTRRPRGRPRKYPCVTGNLFGACKYNK